MDFADFEAQKFLVIVDAKSKFPFVLHMFSTTAGKLMERLDLLFDYTGFPETIVTDNGPPFTSAALLEFYDSCGIRYLTSPPYHPPSNGIAERFVRSFKEGMSKLRSEGKGLDDSLRIFIRQARWSTHSITMSIPAEDFFGREFRSHIALIKPIQLKMGEDTCTCPVDSNGKRAKYNIGDLVWYQCWDRGIKYRFWKKALVTKPIGHLIYLVKDEASGTHFKRHRNQLRSRDASQLGFTASDDEADTELHSKHQGRVEAPPPSPPPQAPVQLPLGNAAVPIPDHEQPPAAEIVSATPRRSARERKAPERFSPGANVNKVESPKSGKFNRMKQAVINGAVKGALMGSVTGGVRGFVGWGREVGGLKPSTSVADLKTEEELQVASNLANRVMFDAMFQKRPGPSNKIDH
jgi:hypothetical protein